MSSGLSYKRHKSNQPHNIFMNGPIQSKLLFLNGLVQTKYLRQSILWISRALKAY